MGLPETFRDLTDGAPHLYSRWSDRAWGLACEGPALRLWDALGKASGGPVGFDDYLLLLREAIGLQYLSGSRPEDLDVSAGGGRTFLGVALCDALPRLLPAASPQSRAGHLAAVWNAGEKLMSRPFWLNRYVALRLGDLSDLAELPEFLLGVVTEGLADERSAAWAGPFTTTVCDPSRLDRDFLPGRLHLAAPSVVCVHDRQGGKPPLFLFLRPGGSGGPIWLGSAACPGGEKAPFEPSREALRSARETAGLPDELGWAASRSGFVVFDAPLSQRLWCVESAR